MYKRTKRSTVELTSLLDLLFVMIFVSLIQQKDLVEESKVQSPPTQKKEVVDREIEQNPPIKILKSKEKALPESTPEKKQDMRPVLFSIGATFRFHSTPGQPNIPEGSYRMQGRYNRKSGLLELGGLQWINRPPNYDMVPLSGTIKDGSNTFTGRIEFIGCETFTLKRVSQGRGGPISGVWEGTYRCSQGTTGLVLTID